MAFETPTKMNGSFRSTPARSEYDAASNSPFNSRRVSMKFPKTNASASASSTRMAETVSFLKRRCATQLGAAMANSILGSYTQLMEWISSERLRRLPTEGSAWDKVLGWAQSFAEKFNDFDLAIEELMGTSYDGAEIAFGYCILLLELGEDNAHALLTSFGFFFQRSLDLITLLDRAELFSASPDIMDELTLTYADLVTLVSDVALRFYQVIRGSSDHETIDIYTDFGSTIESFQTRRDYIVESMWSHQLREESIDTTKATSVKTLRAWLTTNDTVIKYKIGDHTNLVNDRQQLTCLWLQPYITRFLNGNRDSLTFTGGVGSGKSVVAATIVDMLQKTATKRSYSVVYVPINARIKAHATSSHVAATILSQLLEHRVGNVQLYRATADAFEASLKTRDSATYESLLWTAVEKSIEHSINGAKDTIIVVDGIDELSEDPKQCQTLLKHLKDASSKHESVRLITLSQQSAFPPNTKPDVDMTPDLLYDDVFAVVSSLMARTPHFTSRTQIEQDILVDQIVNASNGSFLWAKLVSKSLVMENSQDRLNKAIESLKKSPKSIQDVIRELLTTSNVSDEGRLLVLWLTLSQRPMTVEELSALHTTDPKNGTLHDAPLNILRALQPVASLVFLENGLLQLRHAVIRHTLMTWFEQNKPVKEPHFDFVLRLFTYLRNTIKDQKEPSFTSLTPAQVDQRFSQSPLVEYAVRYWPRHYLDLPAKLRENTTEMKVVFPTSPIVALIEQTTWTWVPTPIKVSWYTTTIDVRRHVLTSKHPIVLQSVINLARIFQMIEDYQHSANYFYMATKYSVDIYSNTHPLTIQCANYFMDVTSTMKFTSRTDIVSHREEILITLIESYKKTYGVTSEQVMNLQTLLIQLYRSVKEEQKAITLEQTLKGSTTPETTGGTTTSRGSMGLRVKAGRTKELDYQEWDFSEKTERDTLVKIDAEKRIDELLELARSHAAKNETAKAEQYYVEAWYYMSMQTKSATSTEMHLKNLSLAVAYANFLKSVKRESEASALLTGVWEEYQSLSASRTEKVNSKLVEVAKTMKSVGLYSAALSVFKHCASVFRSLNKTESSSYKEVQESEQTTQRELLKQASSSSTSASQITESAVSEIFTYVENSTSSELDITSVSAVKKIVSAYVSQHRYKESTHIIKRTLTSIWPSYFAPSIEDVGYPTKNVDFALEMADQLIHCYRLRHRPTKALEFRERLYRALRLTRKVDDKLVQHTITELLKSYEQLNMPDKTIHLLRELLEEYKKVHGPNHQEVIKTLFTLARLTSPEPASFEYYRQIVTILSKDSDICHPDAIEPLQIVGGHYWNERRYPGAVWAYSLLFRTYTQKGKDLPVFKNGEFVSTIYTRYVASLRATTTDIATIYQISTQYREACVSIFGASHKVTIDAILYLARVCEHSKRYQPEAIKLYELLLKESVASEYHAEIKQTLEAIYEEQSLEAARSVTVTASSEQVNRAITVIRQRMVKNRSEFGWAHEESLEQLKEMSQLYARQSKKEEAYKELNEATRQIVSSETSSTSLKKSASTVAESYIAMNETHRALEIAEEMRWQLTTKDSSNSKKYNLDVTTTDRSAAIYVAQLEHSLRQDTAVSFNEIYLSIITEIVYYEEFQRSMRSNLSMEVVFTIACRLHAFLDLHRRTVTKNHVESELVSFFIRSSGDKAKVGDVAQVRVLVLTMLEYIRTYEVKNFVHSVILASLENVRHLLRNNHHKQACDLAQTSFRYVHAVGGYHGPGAIKLGLLLAIAIADIEHKNQAMRQSQIQIAGDIVRQLLRTAQQNNMKLQGVPVVQSSVFISILGEEKDYVTLEWFLAILWEARETHRVWKPAVVLELGHRLVLARFLLGKHDLAIQLATDIAYNLRRVYGPNHLATLEVNILLSQLLVSTGLAFQKQKGAEGIASRYFKRAITVHESVLRSLTVDPLGLGDDDDGVSILSTEAEPMDLSVVVDKDASQGSYARKHMNLMKLALERLGSYPKGFGEYEAINADVFRTYPEDLQGFEGVEKWNIEKFGSGKAHSEEGALNTDIKNWSFSAVDHKGHHHHNHHATNGHADGVKAHHH